MRAIGSVRNLPTQLLFACLTVWLAACAFAVPLRSAPADVSARVDPRAPASNRMDTPGAPDDELPDAPGKTLLLRSCAWCHELTEITKFRGYYTRAQWRDVVVTMTQYGARLSAEEIETLTDYLTTHLGRR